MRRLWAALALIALLLGLSLANGWYALRITDDMSNRLRRAQDYAEGEDWARAEELTMQAYEVWQGHHFYLHTTMRHSDTDQVLRAFREAQEYLEIREIDQYKAACADLTAQLTLLAEMEQPSVVNVL